MKKNIRNIFFFKVLSILLSLIAVPLTIKYLAPYRYGIWITLTSTVGWISLFDFGFGNGLRDKLTKALAERKFFLAKIYISSTYFIILFIFLFVGLIFSILSLTFSVSELMGISPKFEYDVQISTIIVVWVLVFQFVLSTIFPILYSFGKPEVSSIYNFVYQILLLAGVFTLHFFFKPSLIYLAIVWGSVNILILLSINFWFFILKSRYFLPNIKYLRLSPIKKILNLGIKFFILQIIAIIYYESNNILISKFIGPESVSTFSVIFKYMSIPSILINIILTPLWNDFTVTYLSGNYLVLSNKVKKLRIIFIFFVFLIIGMIFCSQIVIDFWLRGSLSISINLVFLMGMWQVLNIWNTIHSTIIYGTGKIQLQLYISLIIGIVNIPSVIYSCQNWGLEGMVFAQILLNLSASYIGFLQVNKLCNGTENGIWGK